MENLKYLECTVYHLSSSSTYNGTNTAHTIMRSRDIAILISTWISVLYIIPRVPQTPMLPYPQISGYHMNLGHHIRGNSREPDYTYSTIYIYNIIQSYHSCVMLKFNSLNLPCLGVNKNAKIIATALTWVPFGAHIEL